MQAPKLAVLKERNMFTMNYFIVSQRISIKYAKTSCKLFFFSEIEKKKANEKLGACTKRSPVYAFNTMQTTVILLGRHIMSRISCQLSILNVNHINVDLSSTNLIFVFICTIFCALF